MSRLRPRDGALTPALLLGINFLVCAGGLVYRAVNLTLVDHSFLAKEGDARFSRVVQIAAHRKIDHDFRA